MEAVFPKGIGAGLSLSDAFRRGMRASASIRASCDECLKTRHSNGDLLEISSNFEVPGHSHRSLRLRNRMFFHDLLPRFRIEPWVIDRIEGKVMYRLWGTEMLPATRGSSAGRRCCAHDNESEKHQHSTDPILRRQHCALPAKGT
jgi:hypothetical protein